MLIQLRAPRKCRRVLPPLEKRFPDTALPKVVFTDRGLGFFHPNGAITAECQAGLKEAGLRAYPSRKKALHVKAEEKGRA